VHVATEQFVYRAHALDKAELVARVLQARGRGATMIFTRTKRTAQKVADDLAERGFKVGAVHGDLNQVAREKALKAFRTSDIDDVTHVINYQCPDDEKTYVHRIGRTGRAGKTGVAVTLVDWDELARWSMIDKALNLQCPDPAETYSSSPHLFTELNIPTEAAGSIGNARRSPAKRPAGETRETSADRKRAPRNSDRSRRRTRGGRAGTGEGSAPATRSGEVGEAWTAGASDDNGQSAPRRRRRRRPSKAAAAANGN
jgi:superfamily II DNA/RNA helicase